jgi:Methyltransferase domain
LGPIIAAGGIERRAGVTTVQSCVVCGGRISVRKKGSVAPFVARRVWKRPAFPIDLVRCEHCDFLFFNPRLDPDEEGRLYSQYRSEEYQQMRHSTEPWYTKRFNAALSKPEFMQRRRERLSEVLARLLAGRRIASVLDFGGDRGALVSGLIPGARSFVYDISGVAPEPGVEPAGDLAACRAREFDLIVNSNVLEHVGFPRVLLEQIRSAASDKTLVFIEVPFESPFSRELVIRRVVQLGVLLATRPSIGLSLAGPRGLCLMHEHINYFGTRSLDALMTSCGWSVLASDNYSWSGPSGGDRMGWCLATVSSATSPPV